MWHSRILGGHATIPIRSRNWETYLSVMFVEWKDEIRRRLARRQQRPSYLGSLCGHFHTWVRRTRCRRIPSRNGKHCAMTGKRLWKPLCALKGRRTGPLQSSDYGGRMRKKDGILEVYCVPTFTSLRKHACNLAFGMSLHRPDAPVCNICQALRSHRPSAIEWELNGIPEEPVNATSGRRGLLAIEFPFTQD